MIEFATNPDIVAAFVTLTILEIVLGIDNLILISILADKLPQEKQPLARKAGLIAALITRLLLLSLAFWIAHLERTLFSVAGYDISWRDLLLISGGLFLIAKGTYEIHSKIEGAGENEIMSGKSTRFSVIIIQIAIMDIVFSFDSVMTAIGMTDILGVMIAAIVIAIIIMVLAVDRVSDFINRNPTVKVLALSYMLLIGMALIGEGMGLHIPKGYLYFAMAFSFTVEVINMAIRKKRKKRIQVP